MSKIVLIGAGSVNFGLGTVGDIFKSKILEGSTITLHDINPKTLENTKNIAIKFVCFFDTNSQGRWRTPAPLGCTAGITKLLVHAYRTCKIVSEFTLPTNYVCNF